MAAQKTPATPVARDLVHSSLQGHHYEQGTKHILRCTHKIKQKELWKVLRRRDSRELWTARAVEKEAAKT